MSRSVTIRRWAALHADEPTEESIRADHPPEKFRVSVYRYPANTKVRGGMRRATCYVLRGVARIDFDHEVIVQAGDVAELPEGQYTLEVIGEEFVAVLCWQLPFEFNRVQ